MLRSISIPPGGRASFKRRFPHGKPKRNKRGEYFSENDGHARQSHSIRFFPGKLLQCGRISFFYKIYRTAFLKSSLLSVRSPFYRRDPKKRPRTSLFGQTRLRIRRKKGDPIGSPFGRIQRFRIRRRRYRHPDRPPRSPQRPRRPRGARGDRPGRRSPPLYPSSDR